VAAPTVVNASSTTAASANSITVTAPSSIVRGRLLLAVIAQANSVTFTTPDGWQLLTSTTQAAAFWKIAGSSEPANYTFAFVGTANTSCALILQIAGNSVIPVEASAAQNNAASASITAPTVTPRWTADLLVTVYCAQSANAITVAGGQSNIGGVTGNTRSIKAGYETLASNAATGTRVGSITSVANNGFNFVIREPVVDGFLIPITEYYYGNPRGLFYTAPARVPARGAIRADNLVRVGYGTYKVEGYAKQYGTLKPLTRCVRLMTEQGDFISTRSTKPGTGFYCFTNLAPGKYTVLGLDQNGVQNGVVAALVEAVSM
jgi:hypothetical protein